MKFFYTLLLLMTLIATSCSSDSKDLSKNLGKEGKNCYKDKTCNDNLICVNNICKIEKDKCKDITCDKVWADCNPQNGKCDVLKEGYCVIDGHCDTQNNEICNQNTFKCQKTCIENTKKCSENTKSILICKNNVWENDTTCENNKVCQKNSETLICKEKCNSHSDCAKKEICNSLGQCIKYDCNNDSECGEINSINNNEKLYCDVLAIPKTCIPFEEHSCGGESDNDISSKAEEIDITDLKNHDIMLNKKICIKDQDWYKINLTKDVSSLNFNLSFPKGDLDLIIVDKNFKTIGYSMASNDTNVGGEETVNSKFLAKGLYYIHIYRYKTSTDTDLSADNDYSLKLSNLDTDTRCTIANKDCDNLKILRSVCDEETGSCKHLNANKTVELGDLCEEKNNCNENASYGCFDMEIQGINLDNYCTKICSSDLDCSDMDMVCLSLIVTSVCVKPCTSDNDCKLILDDETAVCNNGKCN